jgi:hypothetical protein
MTAPVAVLKFVARPNGSAPQAFSNPYDAMTALLGTEGEADVYVDTAGQREALLHRGAEGSWSAVK